MPTVAVVDGVLILFYWNDHDPPHFHADGPEFRAKFSIEDGSVIDVSGRMAKSVERRLREWALGRRQALEENWRRARAQLPLQRIS